MTVAELRARMAGGEYQEWRAFYKYEKAMVDMHSGGGGPIGR